MIGSTIFETPLKTYPNLGRRHPSTVRAHQLNSGRERYIKILAAAELPSSFYRPLNVDRTRPADLNGGLRCFPRLKSRLESSLDSFNESSIHFFDLYTCPPATRRVIARVVKQSGKSG
jgi:hypothetical protein